MSPPLKSGARSERRRSGSLDSWECQDHSPVPLAAALECDPLGQAAVSRRFEHSGVSFLGVMLKLLGVTAPERWGLSSSPQVVVGSGRAVVRIGDRHCVEGLL